MGSVFQRGSTWYIKYNTGERLSSGGYRQVLRACPGMNKKEAQQALRDAETAVHNGEKPIASNRFTVNQLVDEYLKHATGALEAGTHRNYELVLRKHVIPVIGTRTLAKISGLDIQRLYKTLIDNGQSPKSVKNIHSILHKMFSLALRWGMMGKNPAQGVELPKVVKPEVSCTDAEGIRKIITAAEGMGEWRIAVLLAAHTGMRRGEIIGTKWMDYNAEKKILTVRRSISSVSGVGYVEKGTKTDKGRPVALPDELCEALDSHRQQTPYNNDDNYICTRPDGRALPLQKFSENFTRLAQRAGVDITLHGLRHSQVTMLLDANVPVQVVAARVGHSQTTTTLNVYAHALPAQQRQAADVVGNLLRGKETDEQEK